MLLTQPLKWFGGKHYLAPKIIALMPPHLHYVEPFFGGGAVLLARNPEDQRLWLPGHKGVSEVVNETITVNVRKCVPYQATRCVATCVPVVEKVTACRLVPHTVCKQVPVCEPVCEPVCCKKKGLFRH